MIKRKKIINSLINPQSFYMHNLQNTYTHDSFDIKNKQAYEGKPKTLLVVELREVSFSNFFNFQL